MQAVVQIESSFNPYAIGVVGGQLERQPRHRAEAVATAKALHNAGHNISVGLAQVNIKNFSSHGLSLETAFDVCENLRAGSQILADCFRRARNAGAHRQSALKDALSCYYTGDLRRGYKLGYVTKILNASQKPVQSTIIAERETVPGVAVPIRLKTKPTLKKRTLMPVSDEAAVRRQPHASPSALLF